MAADPHLLPSPHVNIQASSTPKPVSFPVSKPISPPSASRPRQIPILVQLLILQRILLTNDGRDKILKIVQYSLKTVLWYRAAAAAKNPKADKVISQFSLTRKIIRLNNWANSIAEMDELLRDNLGITKGMTREERARRALVFFGAAVGLVNGLADDVICYGKLGLVGKRWVDLATPLADQCWYITIFIDVYENVQTTAKMNLKLAESTDAQQRRAIKAKIDLQNVSLVKLMADFVFCSVDVFKFGDRGISDGWQAVSGLLSALLGTYKLWVKNRK
ncbi:hypothetical protein HK104_009411 [Borealophlyctis nickersoniae]|nr:hypothetical protein HK104_009411 [Borealophlyctis nickersoniae]